jgi:hypothetical protein
MRAEGIAKKIWTGYGRAGKKLGFPTNVYRPSSATNPLAPGNLVTTLKASFAHNEEFTSMDKYGQPMWHTIIDGNKVTDGDYLVYTDLHFDGTRTFFLACRWPDLPMPSVYCNSVINVMRPAQNAGTGVQGYGGNTLAGETVVLGGGWPCGLLEGRLGQANVKLPGDTKDPWWRVLLPPSVPVELKSRDIIEEVGQTTPPRRFVVSSAELSELGWRILAEQATA